MTDELDALLDGVTCAGIDADDTSHGARLRRAVASLREQVRALTAERDEAVRDAVNVRANRDESTRQRSRLEEENDALRARVAELEASTAKHHDVALALCDAGAKACRERDAAQQRAKELQRDLDAMLYAVGAKKEAP